MRLTRHRSQYDAWAATRGRRPRGLRAARRLLALGCLLPALTGGAVAAPSDRAALSTPEHEALAKLGRQVFFDRSLSASGRLACATCHDPKYAYGPPPGAAIATGGAHQDQKGTRAVPSLRYLQSVPAFSLTHHFADGDIGPAGGLAWDGRVDSKPAQAVLPLLAANEMANRSAAEVVARLRRAPYADAFHAVFGRDVLADPAAGLEAATRALAEFQQDPAEFFPYTSKYDAFLRGEAELSAAEERGVALFKDPKKGNCASCHVVLTRAGRPPVFTDYDLLNIGVPRNPRIPANADPRYFDLGLCGPARSDLDARRELCGYFKAPTLRNVAVRDAFFHNGVFTTLDEVMHFYVERDLNPEKYYSRRADGSVHKFDDLPDDLPDNVDRDAPLDRLPGSSPALSDGEIADIIAFLNTLTDGYTTDAGARR